MVPALATLVAICTTHSKTLFGGMTSTAHAPACRYNDAGRSAWTTRCGRSRRSAWYTMQLYINSCTLQTFILLTATLTSTDIQVWTPTLSVQWRGPVHYIYKQLYSTNLQFPLNYHHQRTAQQWENINNQDVKSATKKLEAIVLKDIWKFILKLMHITVWRSLW